MTKYWEPGTNYNFNDVVEYNGTFMITVLIQVGFTGSNC